MQRGGWKRGRLAGGGGGSLWVGIGGTRKHSRICHQSSLLMSRLPRVNQPWERGGAQLVRPQCGEDIK